MAKRIIPFEFSTTHATDPLDQFLPETPPLPHGSRARVSLGLVKLILIAFVLCALAFGVFMLQRSLGGHEMQPDIERRQAICELLSLPDAPDLCRGHRRTIEGTPARYQLVPHLAAAFIQARLLELRERHVA